MIIWPASPGEMQNSTTGETLIVGLIDLSDIIYEHPDKLEFLKKYLIFLRISLYCLGVTF